MKLSQKDIGTIQAATGLKPVPEDSAAQREFEPHFGEHTFYADKNGLFIFEPEAGYGMVSETGAVRGVQIAEWLREDGGQSVGIVEPTRLDLVVKL